MKRNTIERPRAGAARRMPRHHTRSALAALLTLAAAGAAHAQVTFVGASSRTRGTNNVDRITIPTPDGTASGHAIVAVLTARGQMSVFDPANPALPTWDAPDVTWQLVSSAARNNQIYQAIFIKRLLGAPDADYRFTITFDQPATIRLAGALLTYSGVGAAAPVGPGAASFGNDPACTAGSWPGTGTTRYNSAAWAATPCQNASYSIQASGLTVSAAGGVLLGAWVHGWSSVTVDQTWNPPAGMTRRRRFENDSGVRGLSQLIGDQAAAVGPTGDRAVSPTQVGGVVHSIGQLIVLCPGVSACAAP